MRQINIRVMVVEDDLNMRDEYRRRIIERPMLQLVAEAGDQEEALEILENVQIDAIILDLELPKGSGILLLEQIQVLPIEKPFIAVVTNVISSSIYQAIRKMGVDYICPKNEMNFSIEVPLSVIEISAAYRETKEPATAIFEHVNLRTQRDIYDRIIHMELLRLGFPIKKHGTLYCKEAILFIALSEKENISMTKDVYPYIASKFETNKGNVERHIRVVVERVWKEQDIRKLRLLYPYEWDRESGRPTNAEFLHNMVKKLIR